jgi:hypothetical protein
MLAPLARFQPGIRRHLGRQMTISPGPHFVSRSFSSHRASGKGKLRLRDYHARFLAILAVAILLAPLVFAQSITGADPSSGKADDTVTLSGAKLAKDTVAGVFLSDDKTDYKATIVSQADDKIVIKVPHVKPGVYNVSVESAKQIMILPVHFTVQE